MCGYMKEGKDGEGGVQIEEIKRKEGYVHIKRKVGTNIIL